MLVTETKVRGASGPLHMTVWEPDQDTHGAVFMMHGLGESSSRYGAWARRFTEHHLSVYMVDQQGHGRTAGRRPQP